MGYGLDASMVRDKGLLLADIELMVFWICTPSLHALLTEAGYSGNVESSRRVIMLNLLQQPGSSLTRCDGNKQSTPAPSV